VMGWVRDRRVSVGPVQSRPRSGRSWR
jgi:hypothetical protein